MILLSHEMRDDSELREDRVVGYQLAVSQARGYGDTLAGCPALMYAQWCVRVTEVKSPLVAGTAPVRGH